MTLNEVIGSDTPELIQDFLMDNPDIGDGDLKRIQGKVLSFGEPRLAALLMQRFDAPDPDALEKAVLEGDDFVAIAEMLFPDPRGGEPRRVVDEDRAIARLGGIGAALAGSGSMREIGRYLSVLDGFSLLGREEVRDLAIGPIADRLARDGDFDTCVQLLVRTAIESEYHLGVGNGERAPRVAMRAVRAATDPDRLSGWRETLTRCGAEESEVDARIEEIGAPRPGRSA